MAEPADQTAEPSPEESAAAVEHHRQTCPYGGGYIDDECPLNDLDPADRFLPEDLEAIRREAAR